MEQVKNEIGVIMSVYNEEPKWLRAAIESILSQTYKTFRYYILLDHPDNDVLKEIIEEYQKKDERILFYQNVQNIGLVYSLNKLIGLVEEPYIARMDAERLAVVLDERYYYDEKGYLRYERVGKQEMSDVRRLFHVLNQAKERLVLVVMRNEKVYEVLLELV